MMSHQMHETSISTQSFTLTASSGIQLVDAEGTATTTLLKNVESVYMDSMSQEDKMKEMMRDRQNAEDQLRRQNAEVEKLRTQLQAASRGAPLSTSNLGPLVRLHHAAP